MNKARTKLVVVTRTKNRPLLLERALQSIDKQTYEDYHHVVLNDGGDKKVVEDLIKKHPNKRRTVIHNSESVGLTKALNQAIRHTDSEYVFILDDDDTWASERLEVTIKHLDETGSKGAVCVMDRVIEEIDGDKIRLISTDRWREDIHHISLYEQCLDNHMTNGCFAYRREVYEELNGYDEKLEVAEDWDFGLRFLLKYDVDFIRTKDALHFYHHRPKQGGDSGNSVFAGVEAHNDALNKIMNKYLRDDLDKGRFGLGYIINSLKYEQKNNAAHRGQIDKDIVRIEGHVNYVAENLERKIEKIVVDSAFYTKLKKKMGSR